MCGIFAVYKPKGHISESDRERGTQALRVMAHRGPDDEGTYCNPRVFLGHRRLSIMDLSAAGHQPMQSADGAVTLVFNGQIYNWEVLREDLQKDGCVFHSECDTESVLNAYLVYGKSFVEKLTGMWALIIWDARSQELIVSRDRLGIKPLYIYQDGKQILFSSEIKGILKFAAKALKINEHVVKRYIARGWLDDIPQTLYQNIVKLPAAGISIWKGERRSDHIFWRHPMPQSWETDHSVWRDQFISVVEEHGQADAMLATTLSGGLDSTAINSVFAKELGRAKDVYAFSLIAPDVADESFFIDHTVKELGISHEYVHIDEIDYATEIDALLDAHDEPTFSAGQVNQFIFRKHIQRKGYKVLLVGDGADEILAGYAKVIPMYLSSLMDAGYDAEFKEALSAAQQLTGLDEHMLQHRLDLFRRSGMGARSIQEYRYGYSLFCDDEMPVDAVCEFAKTHDNLKFLSDGRALYHELMDRMEIDIPQVLRNEDRNGMASSIEVRPVFLDHRLYEQSWVYPFELMMEGGRNKAIMRQALKDIMPKAVLDNTKKFVRPGSVTHLVYTALAEPIRAMIRQQDYTIQDWWRDDLLNMFDISVQEQNMHKALVWMRYYMLNRTLQIKGLAVNRSASDVLATGT